MFVDYVLLAIFLLLIQLVLPGTVHDTIRRELGRPIGITQETTIGETLIQVVSALYSVLLIGLWKGQTLGMMIMRIGVRSVTGYSVPGISWSILRYLAFYALGLPLGIPLIISAVICSRNKSGRMWQDKLARTVVIRV